MEKCAFLQIRKLLEKVCKGGYQFVQPEKQNLLGLLHLDLNALVPIDLRLLFRLSK